MTAAQRTAAQVGAILAEHGGAGREHAVLECIQTRCTATARLEDTAASTLDELAARFQLMGWTVRPTLCPTHAPVDTATYRTRAGRNCPTSHDVDDLCAELERFECGGHRLDLAAMRRRARSSWPRPEDVVALCDELDHLRAIRATATITTATTGEPA